MYNIGIDVSKDKLDVCVLDEAGGREQTSQANTKSGINKLASWLKKQGAAGGHVCLEATGVYGELVAELLYGKGYVVSVVNPARVKTYGDSKLRRNKTDALDAALLADFCQTQQPPAWAPPAPEWKELRALVRHLDDLKQEKQRAKNRLEAHKASKTVIKHLRAQVKLLEKQIAEIEGVIQDHIKRFPDLKRQHDLLKSIPGIGHTTACRMLAELGDMSRFDNARQVVAFVGLNPQQYQSGKKRVTHGISRTGRASLRAALFMPAVVAKRHNPRLHAWAEQLQQRGLAPKQVVVAVMRKLLHLAFAILSSGQPFDPHYADRLPAQP